MVVVVSGGRVVPPHVSPLPSSPAPPPAAAAGALPLPPPLPYALQSASFSPAGGGPPPLLVVVAAALLVFLPRLLLTPPRSLLPPPPFLPPAGAAVVAASHPALLCSGHAALWHDTSQKKAFLQGHILRLCANQDFSSRQAISKRRRGKQHARRAKKHAGRRKGGGGKGDGLIEERKKSRKKVTKHCHRLVHQGTIIVGRQGWIITARRGHAGRRPAHTPRQPLLRFRSTGIASRNRLG